MGDAHARVLEDRKLKRSPRRTGFRGSLPRSFAAFCLCMLSHVANAQSVTPVCDRTEQVRDAIVALVPGVSDCKDVTATHLAMIDEIDLNEQSIGSLKVGDFSGLSSLTRLELLENELAALPEDVFLGLPKLLTLLLGRNRLTELRSAHLNGMSSLTLLDLHGNSLTSLPADVFGGLPALRSVQLTLNDLTSLPEGLFDGLSSLNAIDLGWNELTSLPSDTFAGLPVTTLALTGNRLASLHSDVLTGLPLEFLSLNNNDLAGLPNGLFGGQSALGTLFLQDNPDEGSPPLELTISLEPEGGGGFKATAPVGAPFEMVLPITVMGGSIPGGTVTIAAGGVESDVATVTPSSSGDTTSVDVGDLPALPTDHQGYRLVKDPNLPLVLNANGAPDLVVLGPSVSDSGPRAGGTFRYLVTVHNQGDERSAATTLHYYRSDDSRISTADTEVGTAAVSALGVSGGAARSIRLTAPAAGTYYYGACVDAVTRESDATNNCSVSVRVDVSDEPVVSVRDVGGLEDSVRNLTFEVTLDEASEIEVTVDYATADGTATAGSDYTGTTGTLTLAAGEITNTIDVPVVEDGSPEDDETFTVTLSNAVNATMGTSSATGTILDDDPLPASLSIADADGLENDGALEFPVTLDGTRGGTQSVTVGYATSDGTAISGEDYQSATGTLTFQPDTVRQTIQVTPVDDDIAETSETFVVTLSDPEGATLTDAGGTGTITDDDDPAFSLVGGTGVEGDVVAFSVTLAGPSSRATTVSYATSDGTAVAVDDYEAASGTLTFAPGESSRTVSVSLVDDDKDEPTETFAMTLSSAANATIHTATANGTILDNDGTPRLSIKGASGSEGDVLGFVVTLAGSSGQSVTVSYATGDGTAVAGEDYEATEGVLTFAPGDPARTVSVSLLDDAVYEREENFGLELSSPANATLGTSTATGTIVDDDRAAKAPTKGRVLLFEPSANADRQGFVRIINHSAEAGEILVEAVDDSGMRVGPVTLAIGAGEATHFNSDDLEAGSARKGLPDGVGPPSAGIWRLELSSLLDIEVLSYARTSDGFVTSLHDTAPATAGVHRVVFLNPGRNVGQVGRLRLINPGTEDAFVTIAGTDDGGGVSTEVVVDVPAGTAREWTAAELESGSGTDGALGDGDGKWRLRISSGSPVVAMSLIESPTGNLTNLSTLPRTPGLAEGTYMVPLLPSASDTSGRQGFVRVVNHSGEAAEVRIEAYDNTVWEYEALALAVGADEVASFNSDDLEQGNEAKGLTGSTGAGEGDWWLELSSDAEIEVLSYIRTTDGFLTSMHDLVPQENGEHRVVFFNPAKNFNQVSVLWLVNTGDADAVTTITGVDDEGAMPGTAVRVAVPAGSSRKLTSAELESGEADAIDSGALGDGDGKWRLRVASDRPILVVSLLENPTGHLTNLSTAPGRGAKP